MFPRRHRLQLRQSSSFFRTALRRSTRFFTVYLQSAPVFQVRVVVPKKNGFTSVERHRLKRQIFSALLKEKTHQKQMVIVAKKLPPNYELSNVLVDLKQAFQS